MAIIRFMLRERERERMRVEKKPTRKRQSPTKGDDEPESSRFGPSLRKKGMGTRAWLVLDSAGQAHVLEAGKHSIMRRTGLPGRDLRILDPMLSYPSTVLGREKAIVVNLEHIKAIVTIVTAQEVFLLNSRDPSVSPFAHDLQCRLLSIHQATISQEAKGSKDGTEWTTIYDLEKGKGTDASAQKDSYSFPLSHKPNDDQDSTEVKQDLKNKDGIKALPFEFIALEACLEATCSSLDNEVRDELEHLLDDDEDMAEMYLTEKLSQPDLENSSVFSMNEHDDVNEEVQPDQPETDDRSEGDAGGSKDHNLRRISSLAISATRTSRLSSPAHTALSKQLDVEELEMLLEAYFAQIDGTLNKLTTLREYVDDTEDYINIMLDDKQNHLLRMGVMLSTASLVLGAFITVTVVLGMNITIELFDPHKFGDREFLMTVGGGASSTVLLYVVAIIWCKHKGLLE